MQLAVDEGDRRPGGWYNDGMDPTPPPPQQLTLLRATVRASKVPKRAPVPAASLPVARVAVDVPLAHLDRPFDYVVTEAFDESAVPGCRVRVRFAGQRVDGYLLERAARSDHEGRLGAIERVLSAEVVLRADVARLCRRVADRYAGTFADVVRLAVPQRHAREEQAERLAVDLPPPPPPDDSLWRGQPGGAELIRRLRSGHIPRACSIPDPGSDWPALLAQAVAATSASGRGSIVCLPDARDVARMDAALIPVLGHGRHVVLTAALGPQARYRAFLAAARGQVKVVLGTRAAAFAPVHDLGLLAMWDDGDDLFAEPRAPYPHAREVLLLRAHDCGAGVLLASWARSCEAQALVEAGWCTDLAVATTSRRAAAPPVRVAGPTGVAARDPGAGTRLPAEAQRLLREAAGAGPVLVSVPRSGYRPALACQDCRAPARCRSCAGPLGQAHVDAVPRCRWCARDASPWSCSECGGTRLRAPVVGERRTAEEIGRAVTGVPIRSSGGDRVLDFVDASPQIVVATPGAEPVAEGGYVAALLLDIAATLWRPDLRTAEEALRRWSQVVALVRTGPAGGRVLVVGDPALPALQALVRADPVGFAERELADRATARLPPAVRLATVTGPRAEVASLPAEAWPSAAEVLGPVNLDDETARLVLRTVKSSGAQLADSLRVMAASRSSRKLAPLRIQVDPHDLG